MLDRSARLLALYTDPQPWRVVYLDIGHSSHLPSFLPLHVSLVVGGSEAKGGRSAGECSVNVAGVERLKHAYTHARARSTALCPGLLG